MALIAFPPSTPTQVNFNCSAGAGHAQVVYQVLDEAGQPIAKAGTNPQEKVTHNGETDPNYLPFASPTSTLGVHMEARCGCFLSRVVVDVGFIQ